MSNPTSNFGWQMPTPTDLVTSLPADFEVFGQAVDSTLADLKGGTTGQVLSKNSNTDMDFVWVTDAAGDITGVTAGTGISGGGTSGTVTVTNSMATAIDAKGDLIAGTGADAFSRLAAGSNGETLVADSSTSTGLRYQSNFSAGKNKFINGDFGIWQRGTSFTADDVYCADRWVTVKSGTVTFSRETFTPGTAPVAGYEGQYFMQIAKSAGAGTYCSTAQRIEDVRTFAGQTVTISYWARVTSGTASNELYIGYNYGSGGSAGTGGVISPAHTLTTTWQRFSITTTIASVSGKTIGTSSSLNINVIRVIQDAAVTIQVWGCQIEAGSVATAFQTATGTIQGELAACQRYYWRIGTGNGSAANWRFAASGVGTSTTGAAINVVNPVQMRVSASAIDFSGIGATSGNVGLNDINATFTTTNAVISGVESSPLQTMLTITGTGLTSGKVYYLGGNGGTNHFGFTAEL